MIHEDAVIQGTDEDVKPTCPRGMKVKYHMMSDGTVVVEYEQDAEPLIDAIQGGRARQWLSKDREMMAKAEIPQAMIMEWAKKAGVSLREFMMDDALFYRYMNDLDYRKFRIPKDKNRIVIPK